MPSSPLVRWPAHVHNAVHRFSLIRATSAVLPAALPCRCMPRAACCCLPLHAVACRPVQDTINKAMHHTPSMHSRWQSIPLPHCLLVKYIDDVMFISCLGNNYSLYLNSRMHHQPATWLVFSACSFALQPCNVCPIIIMFNSYSFILEIHILFNSIPISVILSLTCSSPDARRLVLYCSSMYVSLYSSFHHNLCVSMCITCYLF
jgi:hypothetical protein